MLIHVNRVQSELDGIESRIQSIEIQNGTMPETNNDSAYDDVWFSRIESIERKTDEAFGSIIAIVGALLTVVVLASVLLAFKAPSDVVRRSKEAAMDAAQETTKEASYQVLIQSSLMQPTRMSKITSLSKAIHQYPEKYDAYYHRAVYWDSLGRYDKAINDYVVAHKLGLDSEVYYNCIAVAYEKKGGNNKKALDCYNEAIEKDSGSDPEFRSALFSNRGSFYAKMNDDDKALSDYETALEINHESVAALTNRALLYIRHVEERGSSEQKLKEYNLAIKDLLLAHDFDNENENTIQLLIKIYHDRYQMCKELSSNSEETKYTEVMRESLVRAKELIDSQQENSLIVVKEINIAWEEELNRIKKHQIEIDRRKHLMRFAVHVYEQGNHKVAEEVFLMIFKNYKTSLPARNNLAYMKRRGETHSANLPPIRELLMGGGAMNDFLTMNLALCYATGFEDIEKDFNKAIELVENAPFEFEDVKEWWSKEDVVGNKESNLVLLFLLKHHKANRLPFSREELASRFAKAKEDGYISE